MNKFTDLYKNAYVMLEKRTPVMFDCGDLCSAACCQENGLGMLLFPHEEDYLLSKNHGFLIKDSNIEVDGYKIKLLLCNGSCDRTIRPLACRIFPLFPFISEANHISVKYDPRASGTCPLLLTDIEEIYISGLFRLAVYKTATLLIREPLIKKYMIKITEELKTINSFRNMT